MKSTCTLPLVTCLSLSLLAACQPAPLTQPGLKPENPAASASLPQQNLIQTASATQAEPALVKTPASGEVRYDGQTLTVQLQLPAISPSAEPQLPFQTQLLDLTPAAKITATVKDSYNKSYTPVGADGNGQISYPANGIITLTFNNVRPDELLIVETQVTEASPSALIPQADLALALRHMTISNITTGTINFQSTAVAKTLKALLALNTDRARAISLPDLESLMQTITGRSGTAPNYTYSQKHPSQVRTSLLATDLNTQDPSALTSTAANYRAPSATVRLTVNGLVGTDRLQVQLTDAATPVKTNLGNGSGSTFNWTNATPGDGLKLKIASFGTPSVPYTFTLNPATLTALTEGSSQNVTITAVPDLVLSGVSPGYGYPGTAVVITGSGFNASTSVQFNGVTASITLNSPTQITAIVPATAADGPISVIKGGTTVTSVTPFHISRKMYIKANASGSNNGTSWTNAYSDLQTALTAAGPGDELWIAAGTYKPHASDPNVSFVMKDNIGIYGGFAGNESTLSARNFNTHKVILSGDIDSNDDMSGDYLVNYSGNTRELIGFAGRSYTLDGVTLQGASNTAMSMGTQGNPIVRNVIFRYNFSASFGAAIYLATGNATLENLVFEHNLSSGTTTGAGRGGAILITSAGNLKLTNAIFYKNRAEGTRGFGGAIDVGEFGSQATLTNVAFAQNSASARGGAIDIYDDVTLRNVTMAGNTAPLGGGVFNFAANINAKNLLLWTSSLSGVTFDSAQGNITLPSAGTPFVNAANPAGADGIYFTSDDGLNQNGSETAAINSGVNDESNIPALDILGRARVGTHEPGAYEFIPSAPPTLSNFSPTIGTAGTTVTINGTNFSSASAVRFNGVDAASFTVVSNTQITAVVPAGASTGVLTVVNSGGSVNSSSSFSATPSLSGFTPSSGAVGSSVVITGTNFTGATAVRFNATNAGSFTVNSPTQITATVPPGVSSGTIRVTTPAGSVTSSGTFSVTAPSPSLTSFSPTSGAAGTQLVTLTGSNFTGATAVNFNGVSAAFTVISATSITATVPATATDGTISVVTPGGTATSSGSFDVLRTIYVNANASGNNSGTSWTNAYTSLHTALSNAGGNDQIWLAAGTYKPSTSGDINAFFQMKANVDIYGGFNGTESMLAARNPASNVVILSGDLGSNDNYTPVPFTNASDNSVNIIKGASNSDLDGVTLRGANGNAMMSLSSTQTLSRLIFTNNNGNDGAGLQIIGASPTLDTLTFTKNNASVFGGGLYCSNSTSAMSNLSFSQNKAEIGGGMAGRSNCAATLTNASFTSNTATNRGGGLGKTGANLTPITLQNVTFSSNSSAGGGGGMYSEVSSFSLNNVIFNGNSAIEGSSINIASSGPTMSLNRVAFIGGSGSYNPVSFNMADVGNHGSSTLTLNNILLVNNVSSDAGARESLVIYDAFSPGTPTGQVKINNLTVANNTCPASTRCDVKIDTAFVPAMVNNLLVWKDTFNTGLPGSGRVNLGTTGTPFLNSADPDGADNLWFTSDDGYHLRSTTTTAINMGITGTGIPLQDIVNRNRISNPEPGAYEFGY